MRLLSPALIVGLATLASRLLGYARDVLMANILGGGPMAEAFLGALRAPNALRRTLTEGGVNGALTPLYLLLRHREGPEAAGEFTRDCVVAASAGVAFVSGLAVLAAGAVIALSAPGIAEGSQEYDLARSWFLLMIPFMSAATLSSVAAAFLNAEHRFLIPAAAPAIVNAALAAAYPLIARLDVAMSDKAALMAMALSVGGLLQLAMTIAPLLPVIGRARRWFSARSVAQLKRATRLGAPALFAAASVQMIGVVGSAVASWSEGGLVWFYYADRLFQLPLSLGGAVIGSVLLTELSAHHAGDTSLEERSARIDQAISYACALSIPAAGGLVLLAHPIVDVLFGHGAFQPEDVTGAALLLAAMTPGLPAGMAARVLTQELLARQATWASALCGGVATAAALAACGALYGVLGVAGVGLGVAVGLWTLFGSSAVVALRRTWWRPASSLMGQVAKQILATSIMLAAIIPATSLIEGGSSVRRLAMLLLVCTGGITVYGLVVWRLRGIPPRQGARSHL